MWADGRKRPRAVDDLTLYVEFTEPAPRYMWDILIFRADIGIPMTPKHIFETVDDPSTFTFYDPAKGLAGRNRTIPLGIYEYRAEDLGPPR